jgi:hypothetical protein
MINRPIPRMLRGTSLITAAPAMKACPPWSRRSDHGPAPRVVPRCTVVNSSPAALDADSQVVVNMTPSQTLHHGRYVHQAEHEQTPRLGCPAQHRRFRKVRSDARRHHPATAKLSPHHPSVSAVRSDMCGAPPTSPKTLHRVPTPSQGHGQLIVHRRPMLALTICDLCPSRDNSTRTPK